MFWSSLGCEVAFFADESYGGSKVTVAKDAADLSSVASASIKLTRCCGYKITLYKNTNFQGNNLELKSDWHKLDANWQNKVRSVKIEKGTNVGSTPNTNGRRFGYYPNILRTQAEAASFCHSQQGELAVILDLGSDFLSVLSLISTVNNFGTTCGSFHPWIGITDAGHEGLCY